MLLYNTQGMETGSEVSRAERPVTILSKVEITHQFTGSVHVHIMNM